jgi:hypothetical protein
MLSYFALRKSDDICQRGTTSSITRPLHKTPSESATKLIHDPRASSTHGLVLDLAVFNTIGLEVCGRLVNGVAAAGEIGSPMLCASKNGQVTSTRL